MTAHSIVSLIIILCVNYIIYQQNRGFSKGFPIYVRIIGLLTMLPYLVGGMVVISHFTFVSTQDNLIRYGILYGILLLSLLYQIIVGYNTNKKLSLLMIGMLMIFIIRCYRGLTLHHYEGDHNFYPYGPAPTPELFEQKWSIAQWLSNMFLIVIHITYAIVYKKLKMK